MSTRSVYVIWRHPLFLESVRLLLEHPDIQFVGTNSDYSIAREELVSLQPNTIIIEEVLEDQSFQVIDILESCPWNVLVVLISIEDNQLNLYQREQRIVGQAGDLLKLVLMKPDQ